MRHFLKPSGQNTHQSVGRHGCLAFYAPIFRALILAPSRSRMPAIIAARSYHGEKFQSCLNERVRPGIGDRLSHAS
jgi:hypothetical protein